MVGTTCKHVALGKAWTSARLGLFICKRGQRRRPQMPTVRLEPVCGGRVQGGLVVTGR